MRWAPPELAGKAFEQYTVFHPSEVELADVMQSILDRVSKVKASHYSPHGAVFNMWLPLTPMEHAPSAQQTLKPVLKTRA